MIVLPNLMHGFEVALTWQNLAFCLAGAGFGTLVGIMPGIGPITTIAMLLPLTFKMPAVGAFIMLAGIYYGAHHSGSTTAIMLNMPGEPTSVVICFDGHPMARNGRAGPALCIAALSSFFAGCVGVLVIALFAPMLADISLKFGPPEYAVMMLMAVLATATFSSGSLLKSLPMAVLGLLLGTVGTDVNSGAMRYTFGWVTLADGIDFVIIAVGLFGLAEIVHNLAKGRHKVRIAGKVTGLFPTLRDLRAAWKPAIRGTVLGSALGVLPGTGPLISSFASYNLEKKIAKDASRFGHGAIEGVAGPESANNAASITHFIPMLTLGIPAGAAMALMLGALTIQGITPGPALVSDHPDLFWGVVASMWLGNLMLLVLNLPLIGIWIRLLAIPYRFLFPAIITFCCIGVYSLRNNVDDVMLAAGFGVLGYVLVKCECSPAPLILGLVLGPMLEENLRRALLISGGDPLVFVTRPISAGLLVLTALLLIGFSAPQLLRGGIRKRPRPVVQDHLG
jgi:putative tricarboxylic transport membrane protein